MFVLSNFFFAISKAVGYFLDVYSMIIVVRALISWVNPDPFNPIVQFLERVTEPVLAPIRRFLPPMGIDVSPIIVFLIIVFLKAFLVPTIFEIGLSMRG
ncbi:MAG: YggT family protein [Candidatus Omnitrophica bacterium]|nr:YggT family protein [Candidatus Omnitrophota bacterium]